MILLAAKRNGIDILLTHIHGTAYSNTKLKSFRNYFLFKGWKYATHYLACSAAAADFLYGKENRESVVIFNNAIECEKYSFSEDIREEYRKNLGLEGKLVIGNVGRLVNEKNHKYILKIFREIVKINEKAILLLVGDGPLKEKIEKKVIEYRLEEKVQLLGQRNDVNKLLMAMDIFLLPSLFEGLGISAVEAQAAGLPCFLSDMVPREIELTQNVVFESIKQNPRVWAEKICKMQLNSNTHRKDVYKIIASKGYDINQEADKLYNFYISLREKDKK